jgi:tetratricopeptide (TPR) repeat protein
LDAYDKALSINPDDANAWNSKGTLLGNLGRYKEAIECFDRSLDINPHNKDILTFREHALSALDNTTSNPDHTTA